MVTTPVTRDSTAARRYCFVSRDSRGTALTVTRSAANCERGKGDGSLVFSATPTGTNLQIVWDKNQYTIIQFKLNGCRSSNAAFERLNVIETLSKQSLSGKNSNQSSIT